MLCPYVYISLLCLVLYLIFTVSKSGRGYEADIHQFHFSFCSESAGLYFLFCPLFVPFTLLWPFLFVSLVALMVFSRYCFYIWCSSSVPELCIIKSKCAHCACWVRGRTLLTFFSVNSMWDQAYLCLSIFYGSSLCICLLWWFCVSMFLSRKILSIQVLYKGLIKSSVACFTQKLICHCKMMHYLCYFSLKGTLRK